MKIELDEIFYPVSMYISILYYTRVTKRGCVNHVFSFCPFPLGAPF